MRYDVRATSSTLTAQADPARLHQLVANLVDNASRHSPAGGVVRITAQDTATGWRLEVADDGPGIPAADRDRVFERFGTLADAEGGGGTGLGLAIARWVTDLHGGTIHFVDPERPGIGARVRVDLPREPRQHNHVPRSTQEPVMTNPVQGPALTAPTMTRVPEPAMDTLFGRFWPDTGVPGNVRAVLCSLGVGLLAGTVLPFRELGLGWFAVLLAAGGVVLGFSAHRRSPFTLACAALCVLLAATVVVRDAEWIVILCLLAGAAVCVAGPVNGRTLSSSCWRASPGRSPGCGGSRGWVAPCARSRVWGRARPRCAPSCCRCWGFSSSDCCSPPPMRSSHGGWAPSSPTCSSTPSCCGRS